MPLDRTRYRPHPRGSWPTGAQRALLRACLLDGDAGRAAWCEWRTASDLDRIDAGSFRLLGLLYRNLQRLGVVDDPWLPRLKGIYRYFWVRHQTVLRGKPALLEAFHARGIPTLLLKGAALSIAVYRDPGVRPMDDFDVLVPEEQAAAAMAALGAAGLRPLAARHEALPEVMNGCAFEEAPGRAVDLHWRLLARDARPGTDDEFWRAARPLNVGGASTRMLAPADQLLHTAEHGARFNPVPPLRWLADAAAVMRAAGPDLDWDRLLSQTRARGLVLPVRQTLAYLRDELSVEVPREIGRALARSPVRPLERAEHLFAQRPYREDTPVWGRLSLHLCIYARLRRGRGWQTTLRGLPRYLEVVSGAGRPLLEDAGAWLWREGRAAVDRWLGRTHPAPPGSIARIPETALRGFHRPERFDGQPFRWSRPEAEVRCFLPRRAYTVRLDLGKLRGWPGDLEQGLRLWFNDTAVPVESVRAEGPLLVFTVTAEMFRPEPQQVLRFTCPPYPAAPDPRPLGLPLFAIRFDPVSWTGPVEG